MTKSDISLLNKHKYVVTDQITVHIPTIREIRGTSPELYGTDTDERDYYSMINMFSATSSDIMVELDERGIDFTEWSDYNTFLMFFSAMSKEKLHEKSSLLFDNIDLSEFDISINSENQLTVLRNPYNNIIIDEFLYMRLSAVFCTMNLIEKNRRKPANKTAREYIISRQKVKAKKQRKQPYYSRFDKNIIAMVNNCNFKYNYDTVNDLTVYDFMVSVKQIVKKYQVDNLNTGLYMGTIDRKKIGDKLNWLDYE